MKELRICNDSDRRRGILIYRRFGTARRGDRAVSRRQYNANIPYRYRRYSYMYSCTVLDLVATEGKIA